MPRRLIFALLAASLAPASTINVTADSQVGLEPGSSLLFYISPSASMHAPSPYAGQIALLLGGLPVNGATAPIPNSSEVYMPGIVFSATLELLDGSLTIPLFDPNAELLGLPVGDLLLVPRSRTGTGPISLVAAHALLTSPEASALFSSGEAVLRLTDLSGSVTFGYPGSTMINAFSASLSSPDGSLSVGARTMSVELVQTPEPGTLALLLVGLAVLLPRVMRNLKPFSANRI